MISTNFCTNLNVTKLSRLEQHIKRQTKNSQVIVACVFMFGIFVSLKHFDATCWPLCTVQCQQHMVQEGKEKKMLIILNL
jgi:hypothetical protein